MKRREKRKKRKIHTENEKRRQKLQNKTNGVINKVVVVQLWFLLLSAAAKLRARDVNLHAVAQQQYSVHYTAGAFQWGER